MGVDIMELYTKDKAWEPVCDSLPGLSHQMATGVPSSGSEV